MIKLEKTKYYVLACSGGPDSMALFHMLLQEEIPFAVAFVNYHKRKESDNEEEMVKTYAEKHQKAFYSFDALKKNLKGNFQAWARDVRYEFLYELASTLEADGILIAHQRDDLLETYLLQKRRGGIYSYYGLKEETLYHEIPVFRPLLHYRKKELEEYCIKQEVPYSIDSSNLSNIYERNRIRHSIVEQLSVGEVGNLLEEIENVNRENQYLFQQAEKFYNESEDVYSIEAFQKLEEGVQKRVLYKVLTEYHWRGSGKELDAIRLFILSMKTNGELPIGDDLVVYKGYGTFEIANRNPYPYIFMVQKGENISNELFFFDFKTDPSVFYIKEDSYPLFITNASLDDKVKIGTIEKKVNRFFIDEKIPMRLRKIWPCIKDKNGKILFLPRTKDLFLDKNGIKTCVFSLKRLNQTTQEDFEEENA